MKQSVDSGKHSTAVNQASVIVYRTGQLGDTLVSLPAMRAIRDAYPHHELILLTDRQADKSLVSSWDVLMATKIFSTVLYYNSPSLNAFSWLRLLDLSRRIRRHSPEALFCLRDPHWDHANRDRLFFRWLCGIPRCYGVASTTYQKFGRRDSHGNLMHYQREADFLLQVVSEAGRAVPTLNAAGFSLPCSKQEVARIDALWLEEGIPSEAMVIAIAPGSKMRAKRWPVERFVEVVNWLVSSFEECRVIVLGGSEDRAQGESIQQTIGTRVLNLAGELSVLESAEALRRCRLYIGNDTGTMHLAAAAGTPCVVIFSARDHPGRWDPFGENHVVLRTDPPCAGCLLDVCVEQDMRCLKEISVTAVIEAVQSVLERELAAV